MEKRTKRLERIIKFCFVMTFFILSLSCEPKYFGFGVVLWSSNPAEYNNGEVIEILSSSNLNEAYVISAKEGKSEVNVPWWEVEFFDSREEAQKYAAEYKPFVNNYVYSLKEGVPPVRAEMGNSSSNRIIYKFKENQVAKVLKISQEKEKISDMEAYWYYVLLENKVPLGGGKYKSVAIKGYCFGYYLSKTTSEDPVNIKLEESESSDSDLLLDRFFSVSWRPLYFQDMINTGLYDFSKFRPEYGLFSDREKKSISIIMEGVRLTTEYEDITLVKSNLFSFTGMDLRIEMISRNRLAATYYYKGNQISSYFTVLEAEPDAYIEREVTRRDQFYQEFISRGTKLTSSAYGSIRLEEDKEYFWEGNDKLVPLIIKDKGFTYGKIAFPYYLSPALKRQYSGVITFYFNNYPDKSGISFLYSFSESGVKLIYVDKNNISELQVKSEGSNQFIIFFSFEE